MKILDEAKIMIAISLSFICATLLISIGYALFDGGIYQGVFIMIIGYEFGKKATKLIWQHCSS